NSRQQVQRFLWRVCELTLFFVLEVTGTEAYVIGISITSEFTSTERQTFLKTGFLGFQILVILECANLRFTVSFSNTVGPFPNGEKIYFV
ncbi:hypothetical protein HAX54_036364, partial [Datura stramonium]|nr:hypothetical protein [Datura stramonium]